MTIKVYPLRSIGEVIAKSNYEADEEHPNHEDKIVEIRFHGATDDEDFERKLRASAAEISLTNTKKIVGFHCMGGTPIGWKLSREERRYLETGFCERMGSSATKIGWHLAPNRDDFHFVNLNQKSEGGGALKGHDDTNLRRKAIAILDTLHEEINYLRRKNNHPAIPTVADARKRIATDRGREQLAEMIARRAREGRLMEWHLFKKFIPIWIVEAGHQIDGGRSKGNSLSIRYDGTKKNRRHLWPKLQAEVMDILKKGETGIPVDFDDKNPGDGMSPNSPLPPPL